MHQHERLSLSATPVAAVLRVIRAWWQVLVKFPIQPIAWSRALGEVAEPAEIWHGMWAGSLPAMKMLQGRFGGRTIYDSRDVYLQSRNLATAPRPIRAVLAWLERRWARRTDRVITVKEKAEDFYFPLPAAPEIVRIDPEYNLLAKITFVPPAGMINAQLADRSDVLGRLLAIDEVAKRKDEDSVKRLKRVLNEDSFYGAREAASAALRSMQSDSAFEALNDSLKQADARVRIKVLSDIGGFYRDGAFDASRKLLEREKNPDIQAAAITSLGPYHKKEVQSILLRELNSDSFHNTLGDAAINAMRAQDDPDYINPILASLQESPARFTSRGYARALGTLAHLAREEQKKDTVREFLLKHVNDKRQPVQLAAIGALGTLGDAKALPVLEKFADGPKESRERATAEKAVASLRDSRKTSVELGNLRNELLSLQKENRDLRKQFDDLKKKIEAAIPQAATLRTNKASSSARGSK
jgi:aminopeptidase N